MARARRLFVSLATVVGLVTVVAGCSGGSKAGQQSSPTIVLPSGTTSLDRAVAAINETRSALITDMNSVVSAANAVDAIDAASAGGDRQKAKKVRARSSVDAPEVSVVVERLPARVRAYSTALDALSAAARKPDVPARESDAVRRIAAAGRAEADADGSFVRAVAQAWPAYAVLVGLQSLWYERASGDWFSSQKEARDSYAVLTVANRPTTDRASKSFAGADGARRAAAQTWADVLEQERPLLEPSAD